MALKLEEKKSYKTRGGFKATVKKVLDAQAYPAAVEVLLKEDSKPLLIYYTLEGRAGTFDFKYDIDSEWVGW